MFGPVSSSKPNYSKRHGVLYHSEWQAPFSKTSTNFTYIKIQVSGI